MKKKTALIVDDDADLQSLYKRVLEEQNFSVNTVSTSAEAIRLITSNKQGSQPPLDLIILDLSLPDGSGVTVHEALKEDPHSAKTKVIFVSGWDEVHEVSSERLADLSIRKPIKSKDLDTTIKKMFQENENRN